MNAKNDTLANDMWLAGKLLADDKVYSIFGKHIKYIIIFLLWFAHITASYGWLPQAQIGIFSSSPWPASDINNITLFSELQVFTANYVNPIKRRRASRDQIHNRMLQRYDVGHLGSYIVSALHAIRHSFQFLMAQARLQTIAGHPSVNCKHDVRVDDERQSSYDQNSALYIE